MSAEALSSPSWFNTPAKIAALRAVATEWIGTPFFANSCARGPDGGVDCVRLLRAINLSLGVVAPFEIPLQVMDWGDHAEHSLLIEALDTWPALVARYGRLPANTPPLPGDVLCFNGGKVPHHGGLMLDRDEFIHALKPEGVYPMLLRAAIRGELILGRLVAVYRPRPDLP